MWHVSPRHSTPSLAVPCPSKDLVSCHHAVSCAPCNGSLSWSAGPAGHPRLRPRGFAGSRGRAAHSPLRPPGSCPIVLPQAAHLFSVSGCLPRACVLGGSRCYREGGPGQRCRQCPHTSHLPTLALGNWPLLPVVGAGPTLGIRPKARVPGAASVSLSPQSISPPAFGPLSPFLNLAALPLGSEWLVGPVGATHPVFRGLLLLGAPVHQGHLGAREPGGPSWKRAS